MNSLINDCQLILASAGFNVVAEQNRRSLVLFESATTLGFVSIYLSVEALLESWEADSRELISSHQLSLRRASSKAWNTYLVLLAEGSLPTLEQAVALTAVEENLTATRKIVRGGCNSIEPVRRALLPLLPLQAAPHLDAADMPAEIRLRTSELPPQIVNAFLSRVTDEQLADILESEPT